jgi:hypothetical protein
VFLALLFVVDGVGIGVYPVVVVQLRPIVFFFFKRRKNKKKSGRLPVTASE